MEREKQKVFTFQFALQRDRRDTKAMERNISIYKATGLSYLALLAVISKPESRPITS